jgi:hypothetical protein
VLFRVSRSCLQKFVAEHSRMSIEEAHQRRTNLHISSLWLDTDIHYFFGQLKFASPVCSYNFGDT